jgi:hypothetical protein
MTSTPGPARRPSGAAAPDPARAASMAAGSSRPDAGRDPAGASSPLSPDLPVPGLRGAAEAGAELADLGRFVRGIVRDELAAAEHRRTEGGSAAIAPRRRSARSGSLAGEVLEAVHHLVGDDAVVVDDQGDIPVVRDDAMLFVRVLDDPASVLVFCPLVVELPPSPALLERLNTLNEGVRFVRFCATEGGVVVDHEVFGDFFERDMLLLAIRAVAGAAARFGPELQLDFGGRLFLEAERAREGRPDTAGYL